MRRPIHPIDNQGSIRIRFTHDGTRYNIATQGKWTDRIDRAIANAIAARVELDIRAGVFDVTLARYRNEAIASAGKVKRIKKLLPHWDEWVSTLDLPPETQADHYEWVRRMITKSKPVATDAAWFVKAGESVAPSTFNKRLGYLRRCLDWAVSAGKVATNPYSVVKSRQVIKDPVKPFTQDEVMCIMDGFRSLFPAYVPFVGFMLLTGARTSEAIGIQWKRIDFGRGEITIADSLPKSLTGKGRQRKATKTGAVTVLTMNDALRQLLAALPAGNPDDLVFKSSAGSAIDDSNFRKAWAIVLENQGIDYRKPYTTRHTMASHAIEQGIALTGVAYLLGHGDTRMVMQNYGHMVNRPDLPEMRI